LNGRVIYQQRDIPTIARTQFDSFDRYRSNLISSPTDCPR
jgi:hypothetical protein